MWPRRKKKQELGCYLGGACHLFSLPKTHEGKKTTCHISLSYHGVKVGHSPPPVGNPYCFSGFRWGNPLSPPGQKGQRYEFPKSDSKVCGSGPQVEPLRAVLEMPPPCPLTLANPLWSNPSTGTPYPESLGGNARGWTTSRPPPHLPAHLRLKGSTRGKGKGKKKRKTESPR